MKKLLKFRFLYTLCNSRTSINAEMLDIHHKPHRTTHSIQLSLEMFIIGQLIGIWVHSTKSKMYFLSQELCNTYLSHE
uniref:Ovule protein n=1 Tax=Acrobeloides nanus TaxID=290746 RepID=A0A914CPK8_9BILA